MNNPKLDSLLKRARVPEIPEESRAMFPRRVVARLRRNDPPRHPQRKFWPRLAWAGGLAACVGIAFVAGHWHGQRAAEATLAHDSLANITLIRETMAMFPNRVRAIVQDEHGLRLVLADANDVPDSPPIYVRICDGQRCTSLVTFSGQEVQVAGQKVTVLAEAEGGIILTGNEFVWSSTERTRTAGHLKITAKKLGPLTL